MIAAAAKIERKMRFWRMGKGESMGD